MRLAPGIVPRFYAIFWGRAQCHGSPIESAQMFVLLVRLPVQMLAWLVTLAPGNVRSGGCDFLSEIP
jgi:hypothetical protein